MSMTDRKIKNWREEREKELKETIKKAKAQQMHPSFINLLEIQDRIKDEYKFLTKFHNGATEEQLEKFEKTLGITIPASYREFLKFTDGADLGEASIEFFGVNDGEDKAHTLYSINDTEKIYNIEGAIEKNLLIIGEDVSGVFVCINIGTGEILGWDYRDIGEEDFALNTDFYTYIEEDLIGYMNKKE